MSCIHAYPPGEWCPACGDVPDADEYEVAEEAFQAESPDCHPSSPVAQEAPPESVPTNKERESCYDDSQSSQ